MQVYDEKYHASRVIKMMEFGDVCKLDLCPAGVKFNSEHSNGGDLIRKARGSNSRTGANACGVCRKFVGLKVDDDCPCHELGDEVAIKRTVKALKRGGYL